MNKELNNKFAKLLVKVGVNLQPGQGLVINCSVDAVELVREVVDEAYKLGASEVIINWSDSIIQKSIIQNSSLESLLIKDYQLARMHYLVDTNCAFLSISSPNPGIMAGVDMKNSVQASIQNAPKVEFYRNNTMNNHAQWCVASYPNVDWAKKVFPDLSDEEAFVKLYEAILSASHVGVDNDPIAEWDQLNKDMLSRNELLNEYNFESLHFKNSLGTDLEVGLVENHVWGGGGEHTTKGVYFNPNIPTEENFTMPHNKKINGYVYSTKPLNYEGKLIEDFWLKFENGKVVEFDARTHKEALSNLINFDEGSSSLGEVALVPYYSPISLSNILFYNTLFDENASCHLALGAAYIANNLKDGLKYSKEELKEIGCNLSNTHVDFMFGSKDMEIIGTKKDGSKVVVFKDGRFVI